MGAPLILYVPTFPWNFLKKISLPNKKEAKKYKKRVVYCTNGKVPILVHSPEDLGTTFLFL